MSTKARVFSVFDSEAVVWDHFVREHPRAHLLQLSAWGQLKTRFGWDARVVTLKEGDDILAGSLVLLKHLPLRLGRMAYVPMGGYVEEKRHYSQLWKAIRQHTGAAFLKLEPGFFAENRRPDFTAMGFVPSPQSIQPARTIQIDISGEEPDILKRMNQGTRRKIRKSQRDELEYAQGNEKELEEFHQLMLETGARNGFGVHSYDYYRTAYELFAPACATLLTARYQRQLVAAIMVFALGDYAWYFYGASAREHNRLQASYGLQWRAIQWARSCGCRYYDMWGVPDHDEAALEAQFKDRKDGLWGVYGFKRGWGGKVRRSAGTWDLAFKPLVYKAYRAALKLKPGFSE